VIVKKCISENRTSLGLDRLAVRWRDEKKKRVWRIKNEKGHRYAAYHNQKIGKDVN
jgi:hypothetical protein